MENASKALLIAAGVLVGVMLLTMIVYGYEQVASYYQAKEESIRAEQLADFNKQYIPYNRDDVRGSDLLSLVNKIIDYNQQNSEYEEKIEITISINPKNGEEKLFFYNYDKYYKTGSRTKLIGFGESNKFTQDDINSRLISKANEIELVYTQAMATKLAANMSTLMGENTRKTKDDLLAELKINYSVDNNEILKYYQYQQFKRAHFNCDKLEYTNQGRVKKFTFTFNGTFE